MINTILKALSELNIKHYLIKDETVESVELFYIIKEQDMRRSKMVHKYFLTIYKDFVKEEKTLRGSYSTVLFPGMDEEEITAKLKEAEYSASFAANAYYELPKGIKEDMVVIPSRLNEVSLNEAAIKMSEALYQYDTSEDTFINSAELFIEYHAVHIINSEGIDVNYEKRNIEGEFVVQCIKPQDVEYHEIFSYDDLDKEGLALLVKEALEIVKARALAKEAPATGRYDVILSGKYMNQFFDFYISRSNAALIYPGYSSYKAGDNVQGDNISGEKLGLILKSSVPYSREGIKMIDKSLIEDGTLLFIHGDSRYSYYLGIEPSGDYDKMEVKNGTIDFNDMKTEGCLHVLSFSDFSMDDFTGNFSGEIRLAYLYNNEGDIKYITGGSINGSIFDAHKNIVFSNEKYKDSKYEGPFALKVRDVAVAGI